MNIDYQFESLGPILRYVVLVFLLIAAIVALAVIVGIASLPGQVAKQRKHPQQDAINVCGWLGLPTGVLWVIALVWAYWRTGRDMNGDPQVSTDFATLSGKLEQLEHTLSLIENQSKGAAK